MKGFSETIKQTMEIEHNNVRSCLELNQLAVNKQNQELDAVLSRNDFS